MHSNLWLKDSTIENRKGCLRENEQSKACKRDSGLLTKSLALSKFDCADFLGSSLILRTVAYLLLPVVHLIGMKAFPQERDSGPCK